MRKLIVEMELDDTYDTWKSTDEQLVERLIAPTNAGVTLRLLKQCSVSSSAVVHKCIDCGIEDTTVKKRTDGSGYQCYKCYKDELYFEDEYR